MTDEKKERWMELCEQAAKEQDDEKFNELILEVSRLLKVREDRSKHPSPQAKREA